MLVTEGAPVVAKDSGFDHQRLFGAGFHAAILAQKASVKVYYSGNDDRQRIIQGGFCVDPGDCGVCSQGI